TDGYRNVAWLVDDHALTVLPSVASLRALRRDAKPSRAERAFIGFGNPLLAGGKGEEKLAEDARNRQSCPKAPSVPPPVAALPPWMGSLSLRGDETSLKTLRAQTPLPESADELCAVGRSLNAPEADIFLGARATVPMVKSADLARYRIVHFSTHGFMAGEQR